jgi:hypothetical protein
VEGLGKRVNKVLIIPDGDCPKVKQRTWLDKKDWREIHDILGVQGFSWLSNGKDSCWIRLTQK